MTSWTASHAGQRSTMPGPFVYARSVPTGPAVPQSGQVPWAPVRSSPKTSDSVPPTALPSSVRSSFDRAIAPLGPRWPEAFGLDARGRDADALERRRRAFDERGGAADED